MGNSCGNIYPRKHVKLNPEESQYWDYRLSIFSFITVKMIKKLLLYFIEISWVEMGRFDIPASLLYVLKTTEKEMLFYIGNSLDCTLFFIAMASRPELNEHIDVMISLAPVSTLDEVNVTIRLLAAFCGNLLR